MRVRMVSQSGEGTSAMREMSQPLLENDSKKEIWKSLPGYEGRYEVSNLGQVRRNEILAGPPNVGGYRIVNLSPKGKGQSKTWTIHAAVMATFVGERPKDFEINHKDGDKLNNRLENLEYCSRQANIDHAVANGLMITKKVSDMPIQERNELVSKYASGKFTISELAFAYFVSTHVARSCIKQGGYRLGRRVKITFWLEQKLRQDLLDRVVSHSALALKYGLSVATIRKRAKQIRTEIMEESVK